MTLDISNLTKKELIALRRKVDRAIESIDARTLERARREARQLAQSYGVALGDLIEAPKSGSKSGAKVWREIRKAEGAQARQTRQSRAEVPRPREPQGDLVRPRPHAEVGRRRPGGRGDTRGFGRLSVPKISSRQCHLTALSSNFYT